jgi:hypothetical protein
MQLKNKYLHWLQYIGLNSITYLPILIYITRNYVVSHTFHGDRESTALTVFQNIQLFLNVLIHDLNLFLLLLLGIAVFIYFLIIKNYKPSNLAKQFIFPLSYILFSLLTYIAILIYTTSQVKVNPISTRYLSPIYFYFLLFIFIS